MSNLNEIVLSDEGERTTNSNYKTHRKKIKKIYKSYVQFNQSLCSSLSSSKISFFLSLKLSKNVHE
jgi:hypothetical protein